MGRSSEWNYRAAAPLSSRPLAPAADLENLSCRHRQPKRNSGKPQGAKTVNGLAWKLVSVLDNACYVANGAAMQPGTIWITVAAMAPGRRRSGSPT